MSRGLRFDGVMQFLAAVTVLKANDIILTKIGSGLHLDQVKRFGTFILKAMNFADRDVRRLIRLESECLLAARHQRLTTNDNPMFRSMLMLLQRKFCKGFDDDPFDLKVLSRSH